jgi:hypothetical protein
MEVEKIIATGAKMVGSAIKFTVKAASNILSKIVESARSFSNGLGIDKLDENIDVNYLKSYRKYSNTILILARVGSLAKCSGDGQLASQVSVLDDEYIIVEYNEMTDDVKQRDFVYKEKISENIMLALNANDGIIIVRW